MNVLEDCSAYQMSGTMHTTTQHHTNKDCVFILGKHTAFTVRV